MRILRFTFAVVAMACVSMMSVRDQFLTILVVWLTIGVCALSEMERRRE